MTIANIRTAYELEYVPVRAKNARLELVSEIVPVEIEEVDELPAAVEVTVKGEVRQVTFVHDGALYAPFDGGTELDELEAKMKLRGRGPQLSRAHWTIRKDLSHLDLKTVCMLSAAPRDDAVIKELRVDGRAGGLAFAQNIADHMLVHRNRVYMRVEAPTVLHVHSTKTGDVSEVKFEPRFKSGAGATQTSLSRAFRPDDADGVNDWVSRNVPGGWDPYVPGDQAYRWTEAGLAAEDMLSWWTIWSARAVFYESAGRDWNLINASGKSLRVLNVTEI